jgi:hypothetical protein
MMRSSDSRNIMLALGHRALVATRRGSIPPPMACEPPVATTPCGTERMAGKGLPSVVSRPCYCSPSPGSEKEFKELITAMSRNSELTEVSVSRRILWIGAEAYPLQNIARAQAIELPPPRGAAIRHYLGVVIFCVILGVGSAVAATKVATIATVPSAALSALHGVEIVAVALIVISTIRLVVKLSARTLYALVIETAGTPFAALASAERNTVIDLVKKIMDAIDNPQADWNLKVENVHVGDVIHDGDMIHGDKIKVAGSQNVGKVYK